MFKAFLNIFRVPELRNKVLFTLFLLVVYRVGYHVPLPGVNQIKMHEIAKTQDGDDQSALGRLASYVSLFSGGDLTQSTIFGLGIMPYISASIIFQLLSTVVPTLEKLAKEGDSGRRKINEWTRYLTIPLAVVQAVMWLSYMQGGARLVFRDYAETMAYWTIGLFALTAGSVFLMWLGEQIDEYGLGNGASLIIMAGIVARMPAAVVTLIDQASFNLSGDSASSISPGKLIFLLGSFVFVVAGAILITQAQRRIPIQQAKMTRGRKVYGGQKQFLPLRVNHGGVMPIIFAQSIMLVPGMMLGFLAGQVQGGSVGFWGRIWIFLNGEFSRGGFLYILVELAMIYFFAYFWTTVQFQPKELANHLRDYGSFIPGFRPGPRTAQYLEKVMMRITYVGGAFLCIIAVVPTAVSASMGISYQITAFLGGTGLLIAVGVSLDLVQRIEANLMMRNYSGFLADMGSKTKRIRGRF